MGIANEVPANPSQITGLLSAAVDALDQLQEYQFQAYKRTILPIDGYVFWVPTVSNTITGSLHYSQEVVQSEDETLGLATVLFTAEQPVQIFSDMDNDTIWVANQGDFRFAFSQQQGFYSDAGLYHYFGRSIYPALASQLIDDSTKIDLTRAVVSNSLPLWLALNCYQFPDGLTDWISNTAANGLGITLYPSYLSKPNVPAPYATVHIGPEDTRALQAVPWRDSQGASQQLCADRVRLTIYGLQNNAAIDFLNLVLSYSEFTGNFGIMNMPTIRDGKRVQTELQAIGMQKVIDFEVSYNQTRVQDVARALIETALFTFQVNLKP